MPDLTDYKESETRKLKVDLMLEEAGWDFGSNIKIEVPATGMPSASGVGAVDYALYDADGLPLAVVEAKRTSVDPANPSIFFNREQVLRLLDNLYSVFSPLLIAGVI